MQSLNDVTDNNTVRILSLNGGGARGLFTISVLAEIERIIESKTGSENVNVGEYFDLITGTSIGGILALGLADNNNARSLEETFRKNASSIFPEQKHPWLIPGLRRKLRLIRKPLYDSEPLTEVIKSMVDENRTFDQLTRRVMIPAVNLSTGKPQFFKTPHNPIFTRDGRLRVIDAALSTSAAPTYFPPHYCEDLDAHFVDGGLVANNPSFIGLHEVFRDMRSDFPNAQVRDVKILNIGTLGDEYTLSPSSLSSKKQGYIGLWGVGEKLVLSTMTANQQLHKSMLLRELASHSCLDNFVEIDGNIPNEAAQDITLDNATESSLRNLASRGRQLANEQYAQNKALRDFFVKPAKPFKLADTKEAKL
ncbi:CBASS cGAMP-activated phospholipase [Enterovibrio norvegicus]|uniref:CBASS cGAMP-activated phospholipase n=1 Tax=Enterovibrio norvegicus TaxID=188144 RepID=UPI0013D11E16|nr:CBASS cGAMP-activated phospholipase [Enterovibrio norvegicus]